jgi:hypothetical protein
MFSYSKSGRSQWSGVVRRHRPPPSIAQSSCPTGGSVRHMSLGSMGTCGHLVAFKVCDLMDRDPSVVTIEDSGPLISETGLSWLTYRAKGTTSGLAGSSYL